MELRGFRGLRVEDLGFKVFKGFQEPIWKSQLTYKEFGRCAGAPRRSPVTAGMSGSGLSGFTVFGLKVEVCMFLKFIGILRITEAKMFPFGMACRLRIPLSAVEA